MEKVTAGYYPTVYGTVKFQRTGKFSPSGKPIWGDHAWIGTEGEYKAELDSYLKAYAGKRWAVRRIDVNTGEELDLKVITPGGLVHDMGKHK
ncbi:unnamed protein product [marine sediment metagenome]|uniref:Uncharacterized protein n=1 Tax=marine sediment metagenome TaxID=412755 RepID=X1JEZ8_9ZZZZ